MNAPYLAKHVFKSWGVQETWESGRSLTQADAMIENTEIVEKDVNVFTKCKTKVCFWRQRLSESVVRSGVGWLEDLGTLF